MAENVIEKIDKKTVNKTEKIDKRIKVGRISRKSEGKPPLSVVIPETSRKGNVLILGSKLSGKSTFILPYLAKQDIARKDAGCTFIVSKKDLAYTLYAIAKLETKKKVHLIKPSCDLGVANRLLRDSFVYEKDQLKDIINFKEVIKKKEIVIIDMENSKYHQDAVRAVAKLLIQLQVDMQDVVSTIKRDHFVYIDDAQYYLPFIDTLLNHGDDYNISTTLFMQSRNQFKMYDEDYTALINNNVRNYILMNGINFEDAVYFAPFFEVSANQFLLRNTGTLSIAYVNEHGSMKFIPQCEVLKIPEAEMVKIEERAKKERKKLVKTSNSDERRIVLSNTERRGLNALISEEIMNEEKPVKKQMVKEESKHDTELPVEDGSSIETVEMSVEETISQEEAFAETFPDPDENIIPDIGLEDDEETFMPDDIDIEEPDFMQNVNFEAEIPSMNMEAPEASEENVEEMMPSTPNIDTPKQQSLEDEEIVLRVQTTSAYEMANQRLTNKRKSFAPKKRSEIERRSVEDFYTSVLGDKLGVR